MTLLPTPAVNDMGRAYTPEEFDEWREAQKAKHGNGNGHGKSLEIEAQRLLPTPRMPDANSLGIHGRGGQDLRTEIALLKTPTTQLADEVEFLLPTPRATDGTKGDPNQRGSSGDLMLPAAVLLPTPVTDPESANGHARDLSGETRLLPTPNTMDGMEPRSDEALNRARESGGCSNLKDVRVQSWGEYEPAIRRWENATGVPAPAPTETGAKGQPRLAPTFVEWMMGLPAGHVTDPAIWAGMTDAKGRVLTGERLRSASRNAQLKALGNGVVPQQAAAACRRFLRDAFNL